LLLMPVPYYPRRACVFEPETKQFFASPMQGRIVVCSVRPGDSVIAGQLLARLDDDQILRDLATARADLAGASKKRDTALATRASGNAGIADVEMEQAQLRIESLDEQLRRLEIRAIAPGVVVQGDWHGSIGTPVTLGQNLFEVAELEFITAEVRLNASDLGQINVGDEVNVRSDASGGESFRGKISRIEPRAVIMDEQAVFVADVIIRDPKLKLRPGMKAMAQVTAGWKSLGWLMFSRPYRWLANQWIW
jgi:multidrug resistance efflux pump